MKTVGLVIGLIGCVSSLHADIYQWTDRTGKVHFSDKPHEGAKKIVLPPVQTYSPPPLSGTTAAANDGPSGTKGQLGYDQFFIRQPLDQATVRNNSGNMTVAIQLEPELRPTDSLQILIDGNPISAAQDNPVFTLTGIDRGSHTLVAQILTNNDDVLASTEAITFYMHRAQVVRGGD